MSIDLSQFHRAFFEESFEATGILEENLLNLNVDAVDPEVINTIFRCAHSIKGSGGSFGFKDIAAYTHILESLLDQVRAGQRRLTAEMVDVLLQAVDCLRMLLTAARDQQPIDPTQVEASTAALRALQEEDAPAAPRAPLKQAAQSAAATSTDEPATTRWRIVFAPHRLLMQNGNDPLKIIRELASLGSLTAECDLSLLPDWDALDPTQIFLSWTLNLETEQSRAAIDDVFAWVEDECDFAILPLPAAEPAATAEPAAAATSATSAEPAGTVTAIAAPAPTAQAPAAATSGNAGHSIRVDLNKIDALINMVGELVITQSMLSMLGEDERLSGLDKLHNGLAQLRRHTRALQEGVMQIRMLPISFCFNRFPRVVRDVSRQLEKKIELVMVGENTEVDKTVIEEITDPLVHLIRNSIDHGIETPAERVAAGKPETGTIWLKASHQVGNIIIEVIDDGHGLNAERIFAKAVEKQLIAADAKLSQQQIYELIFLPGFSTAAAVSDLSGRGVGMDVVRRNVANLGGSIEINSNPGQGSSFTIRLPLSLAIMDGQLVRLGDEIYIIPLVSIIESLQLSGDMINRLGATGETFKLRGQYMPILRLGDLFGVDSSQRQSLTEGIMVVIESDNQRCGLYVDDLLNQQQIVIKSLDENYRNVEGLSGATILGDGKVALILDIPGLIELAGKRRAA